MPRDRHLRHLQSCTGSYYYAIADTARHLQVVMDSNVDQPFPAHVALDLLEAVDREGIHKLLTYGEHGYGSASDGLVGGN